MKNLIVNLRFVLIVLGTVVTSSFLLVGCDPFGNTTKKLSGRYFIQVFDEALPATYYIIEKGVNSGGGVFDGSVKQLIWIGGSLFADVQRLSSSDINGWYKLDLQSGSVSGPLNSKNMQFSKSVSSKDFFQAPKTYFYSK